MHVRHLCTFQAFIKRRGLLRSRRRVPVLVRARMLRASAGKTPASLSDFLTRFKALNHHVLQNEWDTQYIDLTVWRSWVCFVVRSRHNRFRNFVSPPRAGDKVEGYQEFPLLYSATKLLNSIWTRTPN